VEGTLVAWWQDLLGVEQVALEDDFFGLGGHSLVGVRLFAKIKKTYQVDLELAALFEARTVSQLAKLIRKAKQSASGEQKAWPSLVPLQPRGSQIPFFCFHHLGGEALVYEPLAKALGPDQPLYVFRSPLVYRPDLHDISLEELAATYVKELRAFYPEGPYLLGGVSFGGLVAFQVSQQLHAEGTEPGLLVLFDTSIPGSIQRAEAKEKFSGLWRNYRRQGASYLARKVAQKVSYWWTLLVQRAEDATCLSYRLVGRELPPSLRYYEVREAHLRAQLGHNYRTYPGKITLMRALDRGAEVLGKREDPILGWGALAGGGLEVHDFPADHTTILMEPFIQDVADTLKTLFPQPETIAPHRQSAA